MNKNLKVVSSLALAGILATTGLAGLSKVSAAEVDPSTKSLGKYATLGGVENVVPYILNAGDKVTIKDLKTEYDITAFNGKNVASEDTVVGTGDTFKSGNTTYTVIVYGDTNGDGLVDSDDAFDMLSHYVGNKTLSGVYLEAANVEDTNRNDVDSDDAYRTKSFYVGNTSTSRDKKPTKVEPVVGGYTLTIGDNNVVNNKNNKGVKCTVLAETSNIPTETAKDLKITVKKEDGSAVDSLNESLTLAVNTNKVVTVDGDAKDYSKDGLNIANGTYTAELKEDGKSAVLARTTFTVKVLTPAVAKLNITRSDAETAKISFEGYGEGKIVTVKYSVNGEAEKEITKINNKLEPKPLDSRLTKTSDNTVDLTFVDEYGNETTMNDVNIPDFGAPAETAVVTVEKPDLSKETAIKFTAKDKDGNAVASAEAALYDANGKIITTAPTEADGTVDFTDNIKEAGKYRVGVTVLGKSDATTTNSTETFSEYIEVKELKAVTNVAFNITKDDEYVISWNDSNDSKKLDNTTKNDTEYTLTFEKMQEDGTYKKDSTVKGKLDAEKHTFTITKNTLEANEVYKVTVEANPSKAQVEYIKASKPGTSTPFFYIDATQLLGDMDSKTYESLTYVLAKPITINGVEATYKAKVNKVVKDENNQDYSLSEEIKTATVSVKADKTKVLTINGLDKDQRYTVKIIANVGNVSGQSGIIGYESNSYESAPATYDKTPTINKLKIVKDSAAEIDATKAVKGTLYINGDNVVVDGNVEAKDVIDISKAVLDEDELDRKYEPSLYSALKLAKTLVNNDVLTVNKNAVALELTNEQSDKTAIALDNDFEGMDVTVKGTGVKSDRTLTVEDASKLAKLNIGGDGLILALTNSDADTPVYVNNGAAVTCEATTELTLVKGATAIINGVTVNTTSADIAITAVDGNKNLIVTAPTGILNTDLAFTNNNDKRYPTGEAKIDFVAADQTSKIQGTVKINSTEGSVKVTSPTDKSLDLSKLNLEIDVKDADVDVTGFTEGATVNVKVATTEANKDTTTVKGVAKEFKLLEDIAKTYTLAGETIELKTYEKEDDIKLTKTDTKTALTEDEKKVMQQFIDSFGIKNIEGITLTFGEAKKESEVTITFPAETNMSNVTLKGFATFIAK